MIEILSAIDAVVWGPAMIALLLGSHIFLTVKTGFIQRRIPQAIRMSWKNEKNAEGDISNFGALSTALAATIGTGSIVGVATAILAGGPGAVFWMWMAGIFGIATKYTEVFVSIKYRVKDHNGEMLGGAMYAWERGFQKNGRTPVWAKAMAVLFALFAAIAAIGTGSAVQASAMTGIITAAAQTKNPAQQALVAMTGTFWSTVVICLLTGIVLVSTMLAYPDIQESILENPTIFTGAQLASIAFSKIPVFGTPILVLGMVAFSYSTILGWSYYGTRCAAYLFGKRGVRPYQVVYVAVAFLGAIGIGDAVWLVSDIGNALMAIPNILVVLALSGLVARETKHYVYEDNLDEASGDEIPIVMSK